MKKSEKIELRVNYAEKERLASIAERRGLTISDVVRGALAGELGDAPVQIPKWPGMVALCALGVAGLALIMNWKSPVTLANASLETATFSVQFWHPESSNSGRPVRTTIQLYDGFSESYKFSGAGAEYRISLLGQLDESETLHFKTEVCRVEENKCRDIPTPDFSVVLAQSLHQAPEVSSARGSDGEVIELSLLTRPIRKPTIAHSEKKS